MKKIIHLSENELINVIKRVIKEQSSEEIVDPQDMYNNPKHTVGKFSFKDVTKEKMPEYMKWYLGGSYPEIQEYISRTYGIPKPYPPKDLENPSKQNSHFNLFKQFLNAVNASLYVAA